MLHDRILLNHGSRYIYSSFEGWKVKNGTERRTTDHNIGRLYGKDVLLSLPTDTASTYVSVLPFVFVPCIFGKAEVAYRHIIADLQATFVHGVAAHCNRIFYRIFLRVIILQV